MNQVEKLIPTESQMDAITTIDQNVQIIACAGSGKTDTIVKRIINILKVTDSKPENIIAFTYTEKAATEMRDRIYLECEKELGSIIGLAEMYIGTIHSFCKQLLQDHNYKYLKYTVLNEIQTRMFIDKTYSINGLTELAYKGKPLERFKDSNIYLDALNTLRESTIEMPEHFESAISKYESALCLAR